MKDWRRTHIDIVSWERGRRLCETSHPSFRRNPSYSRAVSTDPDAREANSRKRNRTSNHTSQRGLPQMA